MLTFEELKPIFLKYGRYCSRKFRAPRGQRFELWELINAAWCQPQVRRIRSVKDDAAALKIYWAMLQYIGSQTDYFRKGSLHIVAPSQYQDRNYGELFTADNGDPVDHCQRAEARQMIKVVPRLQDRKILWRRCRGQSLRQIARLYGMSAENIRRLEARSLRTIRSCYGCK